MSPVLPPILMTAGDHAQLSAVMTGRARQDPVAAEFLIRELERAEVIKAEEIGPGVATMGSYLEFRDDDTGQPRRATLAYPGEVDLFLDGLSVLSPVGAALIGLTEGQSIEWSTPSGSRRSLTLLKVFFQPWRVSTAMDTRRTTEAGER